MEYTSEELGRCEGLYCRTAAGHPLFLSMWIGLYKLLVEEPV